MDQELMNQMVDWVRSRYFGKYRGTVVDSNDDTRRGRLRVEVPAVLGELKTWAMPCVPYAGNGVGFYSLPPEGSGVWVEFEGGDPSYPIWSGCFWADNELPDDSDANIKVWKTEKFTVRVDDQAGELKAESRDGSTLVIGSEVKAETGKASHTVSSSGITAKVAGTKTEVSAAAFKVNDGALEVI